MAKTREEIISNIDDMKQYLKDAYLLAKERECAERQIKEINRRMNKINKINKKTKDLDHRASYPIPQRERSNLGIVGKLLFSLFVIIFFGGVLAFIFAFMIFRSEPQADIFFVYFIRSLFITTIFWVVICIRDKKSVDDKFRSEMRDYEQRMEEDKKRVKKDRALVRKYQELAKIYSQNRLISLNALNRLLNLDIIFPKYRNLIAISQIYEYFMSGRCTELEGLNGAYNLYEHEMRMNIIIDQLDTILCQLGQIQQSQYMLYSAIREVNKRLGNIESNTAATALNTSIIALNSEITARYY